MPLGDSITMGCCSGTTVQGGYRNKLYNLLTAAGYNVDYVGTQTDTINPAIPDWDHQGMGGYRIEQIQSGLPAWFDAVEDPDVVLLLIGVNDFWQGYDLANVQTRMSNLIATIATQRPYARIILSNLTLRTDDAGLELLQSAFNDALPALVSTHVALGRHVTLVDMHSAWVPGDLADGVHPKLAGYDKMAPVWFSAITSVITPLGTADPPAIVRAEAPVDYQHVTVRFSKPLADSAANPANFSANNGLTISQAVLDAATLRSITLTTSTQTPGTLYTLTVSGVRDRTPQQTLITPGSTVTFSPDSLTNGGFESGLTGWSATGNVQVTSGAPYVPSNGTKLAAFNAGQTSPNGVLSQSFATVAGQSYSLTFDAGVLAYNTNPQSIQVNIAGSGSLLTQTITLKGLGGGSTLWTTQNFTFVSNSSAATLTFRDASTATNNLDLLLDNVRVTRSLGAPNTAPVANADSYATYQDTPLTVSAPGVLGNDTDAQSNNLTAVLDAGPGHGSVTLNADGGFTYTPAAGYTGTDSFTYHANDGNLDSNIASVSISVNAIAAGSLVNGSFEAGLTGWTATGSLSVETAAPYVATDGTHLVVCNGGQTPPNGVLSQTFTTVPGQTYTLAFDMGVLAYNKNQQSLLVTVTGTNSLLSQSITLNGTGGGATRWVPQSFTFVANSGSSTLRFQDKSTTTNNLDLLLDNVRVSGPAGGPNTAPVAGADSYAVYQDSPLVISAPGVLGNDTDAQANALTAVADTGPVHGSLTLNADGGFTYTPTAAYTGADSFTYHANDGSLNSNVSTVTITVNAAVSGALANGSFEAGLTGWTATGNLSVETATPYVASDGTHLVEFNGGQTPPNGVLSQTFATTVGLTYTLAFDMGVLAYNKNPQTLLTTVTGTGNLLSQTITLNGLGGGAIRWVPQSFTFVANSTTATLTFQDKSSATNNIDLLLDHISLTISAGAAALTSPAPAATTTPALKASAITAAPSETLGSPQLSGTPGDITILMTAKQDGSYVLERSRDLTHWEEVGEQQCPAGQTMEFHDPLSPSMTTPPEPQMFYRIRLRP